jgi:hypothetical protein
MFLGVEAPYREPDTGTSAFVVKLMPQVPKSRGCRNRHGRSVRSIRRPCETYYSRPRPFVPAGDGLGYICWQHEKATSLAVCGVGISVNQSERHIGGKRPLTAT